MSKEPMEQHMFRIPRWLWQAAVRRADERDETVSEAVRRFLERYVK